MIWANLVYTLWIATQYQFQPRSRMAPEGAMRSETSSILAANRHCSVGSASGGRSLSSAESVGPLSLAALHCAAYGQGPRAKIMAPGSLAETAAPAGPGACVSGLPLSLVASQGQIASPGANFLKGQSQLALCIRTGSPAGARQKSGRCWPIVRAPHLGIAGEHPIRPAL